MSRDKTTNQRQPVRPTLLANVCRSQSLPSSAASSSAAGESGVLGDGISGSAMAVPPPKAATSAVRPENTVKTVKGGPQTSLMVSKSDSSDGNVKQMKEVTDRNQELRDALVWYFSLDCFSLA